VCSSDLKFCAKQGDQYPVGGDGLAQNFAGGKIFFSPATGANAVETDILTKYEALGGPANSDLGFPIANEAEGGVKPASKVSSFSANDKPVIFWTSDHGAFVVRGAIKAAWDKLLGATGKLGAPLGDQVIAKDVVTQKFTGGQIAWNKTKNSFTTQPPNLASALSGLQIPGQKTPAGSVSPNAGVGWLTGHWLWLLAGAAALLLVVLLALVARWWRRHRAVKRAARSDDISDLDNPGYEAVTESVSRWSPEGDSDLASSTLSPDFRPRPRTVRLPSQPSSAWMPPSRKSLVDELLAEDETDSPEEFSEFDDFGPGQEFDRGQGVEHDTDFEHDVDEHFDEDPDDVDTDPTGIPLAGDDARAGRHAAADGEDALVTEAVPIPRIAPGQLAIHLPMDDPYQVPDGYPVKANASSGLYYMPDSALYEDTQAEIWFASEDVARANGFNKAG
jgi:uncharacterized protein with LGFP repeats